MNNKGFAITGILYTLFVLFTMILLSILAAISYKRSILEQSIIGLEDSFKMEKVETIDSNVINSNRMALLDGKYEFTLNTGGASGTISCVTYLKKGEIIPEKASSSNDILFIPNDCNNYNFPISLNTSDTGTGKLILKNVYKLKG